jgi:hypothetical protein
LATGRTGALLTYDAGDPAGGLERLAAGARKADAIGAYGWANLMLVDRFIVDNHVAPEVAIPALRDLLARIRPSHMFAANSTVLATYLLARWLGQRNAPGDLEEAFALARATEKALGRSVPGNVRVLTVFLAIADGRPRDAARLYGYTMSTMNRMGINFTGARQNASEARERLLELLSETDLEALMAEGERFTPEQHFALATKLED